MTAALRNIPAEDGESHNTPAERSDAEIVADALGERKWNFPPTVELPQHKPEMEEAARAAESTATHYKRGEFDAAKAFAQEALKILGG